MRWTNCISIFALVDLLVHKTNVHGLTNESASASSRSRSSISSCSQVPLWTKSKIDVWNNVIDVDHIAASLHEESRRIGLGHKVFSRPSIAASLSNNNIIEKTLDSILTELNDNAKYVEYWTRREWRSIHAHADVDEYRAKEEHKAGEINDFRYPRNGHVLYLQVGTQVKAPTCVFLNRTSGGDLLRKQLNDSENDELNVAEEDNVDLITVPAVPGRLLRFQGNFLHAVPRPTDFWLLKFVKGSQTFEPEEEWGRSVVLFNTWNDEPPLGLPVDENDEDHSFGESDSVEENDDTKRVRYNCNKMHEWIPAPVELHSTSLEEQQQRVSTKVWLLGDYRRRDYKMQTVKLEAEEGLRKALYQGKDVMYTKLTIPV